MKRHRKQTHLDSNYAFHHNNGKRAGILRHVASYLYQQKSWGVAMFMHLHEQDRKGKLTRFSKHYSWRDGSFTIAVLWRRPGGNALRTSPWLAQPERIRAWCARLVPKRFVFIGQPCIRLRFVDARCIGIWTPSLLSIFRGVLTTMVCNDLYQFPWAPLKLSRSCQLRGSILPCPTPRKISYAIRYGRCICLAGAMNRALSTFSFRACLARHKL